MTIIAADDPPMLEVAQAIEKLAELPWPIMREPTIAFLRGDRESGAAWMYVVGG